MQNMTGNTRAKLRQISDADQAIREIRELRRRIVTFSGFSSNGYEDRTALEHLMSYVLDELDPAADIVCSGATSMGIGAIYALAASREFRTIGIVSSKVQKEASSFADNVDIVFVIEDDTWGGYIDNNKTLSPTSRVMVHSSDLLVFIGGGDIARDEYDYAARRGQSVRVFAADMNHAALIDKARRKGKGAPTDFKGALANNIETGRDVSRGRSPGSR